MSAAQEMIQDKESTDSIGDNESIGMPSTLSKKRRGKNQGIPASEDNTRMHIKLNCHGVACGKFAKKLGTQMGIYVRNVPISYRSWKEVQMEWKNTLWEDFILKISDQNKKNRSKEEYPSTLGKTSYVVLHEEHEKIDQALVNVDDGDDEDVVGKALGKKKGWVKGYGTGIAASSLRASKPARKRLAIERDRNEKLHGELTDDDFPVHYKVELMTWTSPNPVAIGTIEYATPETIIHHSPLGLHFKKITLIEVIDRQADLPKKTGMAEKLDDIGEGGIIVWPSAFLRKMD